QGLKARAGEGQGILADREEWSGVNPFARGRALERAPGGNVGQYDNDVGQHTARFIRHSAGDGRRRFLRKDSPGGSNEEERRAASDTAEAGAHDSTPLRQRIRARCAPCRIPASSTSLNFTLAVLQSTSAGSSS